MYSVEASFCLFDIVYIDNMLFLLIYFSPNTLLIIIVTHCHFTLFLQIGVFHTSQNIHRTVMLRVKMSADVEVIEIGSHLS